MEPSPDTEMHISDERVIKIKTMDGQTLTMTVDADATIETLKQKIATELGLEPGQQRLIHKAKQMKDGTNLNDYIKENDQVIHLVKNQPAQAPNTTQNSQSNSSQQQIPTGNLGPGAPGENGQDPLNAMLGNIMGMFNPGAQGGNPQINIQHILGGFQQQQQNPNQQQPNQQPFNPLMNMMGGMRPPAPQQPSSQPQPQAPHGGPGQNVIQLPHQHNFQIGSICNNMMGPEARFPGPVMPQLPFERNLSVLLGSFMINFEFNMQRLIPLMQRTGDLMQRESLLTNQRDRQMLQDMVNQIGVALGEVARSAGTTSHLYRSFTCGNAPGQGRVDLNSYLPEYESFIRASGTQELRPPNHPAPQASHSANQEYQANHRASNIARSRGASGNENALEEAKQKQQQEETQKKQSEERKKKQEEELKKKQEEEKKQSESQAPPPNPFAALLGGGGQSSGGDPMANIFQNLGPMMQQMMGSGVSINDLATQLGAEDEGEEEEESSNILMKIFRQFSLPECMQFMQGNLEQINGLNTKIKEVLFKEMGSQDLQESRKLLADREGQKMVSAIFIPDSIKGHVFEGFDPLVGSADIINKHVILIINCVMNFDANTRRESEFAEEIKKVFYRFIGEWIDEIQDGFENEFDDVKIFFQENIQMAIMQIGGPEIQMMSGMIVPQITQKLEVWYSAYQQEKRAKPSHEESKYEETKRGDEEMKESQTDLMRIKWRKKMEAEAKTMQEAPDQKPLSKTYKSVCVYQSQKKKQVIFGATQEAVDGLSKIGPSKTKDQVVYDSIRKCLVNQGTPSAKIDDILKSKGDLPEELVNKYFGMIGDMVRQRKAKDSDFKKGDPRFKHMDSL